MIRATRKPGQRVYLFGHRCHHGMLGAVLAAGGLGFLLGGEQRVPLGGLLILAGGVVLMLDDWRDFPWTTH